MQRLAALCAVRASIDIVVHLELEISRSQRLRAGEYRNAELGQEFCNQRSQCPLKFTQTVVLRYMGMPGRAITCKPANLAHSLGEDGRRHQPGPAFDLEARYKAVLDLTTTGLPNAPEAGRG